MDPSISRADQSNNNWTSQYQKQYQEFLQKYMQFLIEQDAFWRKHMDQNTSFQKQKSNSEKLQSFKDLEDAAKKIRSSTDTNRIGAQINQLFTE